MCDHKTYVKTKGSYYWVCDNDLCFLTDDEYSLLTKW